MSTESVIEDFSNYGLGEKETNLLMTLAKLGPIKASSVARNLGINRMAAYRMLSRLTDMGLLQVSAEKPMRFAVAPIEEILEILTKVAKERLDKMDHVKEGLIGRWKTMTPQVEGEMENRFRIVQGREQIYNLIKRMCNSAEKDILIMTTSNDIVRMRFAGVDDILEESSRRGIRIRIVSELSSANLEAAERLMDFSEFRHIRLGGAGRLVITDEKEILTSLAFDDSISLKTENDLGLWTDGKQYIMMLRDLFQQTVANSTPGEETLRAIKSGKPVEELRIVRGEKEFENVRENLVTSAKERLFIVTTNVEKLSKTLQKELTNAHLRGVRIEAMTTINDKNLRHAKSLGSICEMRHTAAIRKIDLVIADGSQCLLSLEKSGGREAIWSNVIPEVETIYRLFETPWSSSVSADERITEIERLNSSREYAVVIGKSLRRAGWAVSSPGKIDGSTAIGSTFDLVAKPEDRSDKPIAVDIMFNQNTSSEILMNTLLKATTLEMVDTFIVAVPKLVDSLAALPDLYGVKVIESKTPEGASRSLLGIVNSPKSQILTLKKGV